MNLKMPDDLWSSGLNLVLVSFCNQRSSPFHSLCIMNLTNGGRRWIDLSLIPETHRENFAGLCGICSVDNQRMLVATQGSKPGLALVDLEASAISYFAPLTKCKDTHSILLDGDFVYAVSTGTNEVYRIPLDGQTLGPEEIYWQYPDVRHDQDEIHLNGLSIDDGRLVASCFGPRGEDGSWTSNGMVFYLDTGEVIRNGLKQPHTPLVVNDRLFFAESRSHKVYLYNKLSRGAWNLDKEVELGGYARGLTFNNGRLLVGISASRKTSRSKKTANLDIFPSSDAAIIAVDVATGNHGTVTDLVNYGRELYDIVSLSNTLSCGSDPDAVTSRIRELESTVDRYAADVGGLWLQTKDLQKAVSDRVHDLWQLNSHIQGRESPRVSVIIPTYNRAQYILEAVESVLSQDYPNFEVIVVDDGSTDHTAEIIGTVNDSRLRYIKQPNQGRSSARNRALTTANGDFITFLDSDDLYMPGKIALQVEYLLKHPETGMIYTSAHCIDDDGDMLQHKYEATVSGMIYEQIAFFQPVTITLPTVMTRREVLDRIGGFDEKMHRFEDTDMWRRISKLYRIDALPVFSCKLRTHDDNSLRNQNPSQIVDALNYYSQKITKEDMDINPNIRSGGLARLYRYYGAAMMTVPAMAPTGVTLMRTALKFDGQRIFKGWIPRCVKAVQFRLGLLCSVAINKLSSFYRRVQKSRSK